MSNIMCSRLKATLKTMTDGKAICKYLRFYKEHVEVLYHNALHSEKDVIIPSI